MGHALRLERESLHPVMAVRKESHLFVHTVRFWSMVAVIAIHCVGETPLLHPMKPLLMTVMTQPFKFGTIGFFLISGFLMGERLQEVKPGEYLRRRVGRLMGPWGLWLMVLIAFGVCQQIVNAHSHSAGANFLKTVMGELWLCLFHSPFWFVPNLLIGMMLLLLLRRHIEDWRLGVGLLAVNLFWVVNIYACWVPSEHTEAVLGFVFYMWLGAWCAARRGRMQRWLDGVPKRMLVGAVIVSCTMAMAESQWLESLHRASPLNTLRLSNQIYSVAVVMLLMRVKRASWPKFIDVRAQTFGLYLVHPLCLSFVVLTLRRTVGEWMWSAPAWTVVPAALLVFAATYAASLVLTNGLASTAGLEWTVGAESPGTLRPAMARPAGGVATTRRGMLLVE